MKILSKKDIENKLINLLKSEEPQNLAIGAMCYKVAAPPNRVEYICPNCNEKTLWTEQTAYFIDSEIYKCRQIIENLGFENLKLKEIDFCKNCSPLIENPSLKLEIHYDENEIHSFPTNSTNLTLLKELLEGKDKHTDNYDYETPLKNYIFNLQHTTGIKNLKLDE